MDIFIGMVKLLSLVIAFLIGSSESVWADRAMNGYRLKDYKNFDKNWTLVTTRYREDTGEMRFTYANDIAWQALLKASTDYPDGSIFAKFSAKTMKDLDFPSSKVPRGTRRFQLMVRNKKKHKSTYGWGYALFQADGKVFPGDMVAKTKACAACHNIVAHKGHVFSEPLNVWGSDLASSSNSHQAWTSKIRFLKTKRNKLPKVLLKVLPSEYKSIYIVSGELESSIFFGTLDEIRPLLMEKAFQINSPTALISKDKSQFSVVWLDKTILCGAGLKGIRAYNSSKNKDNPLVEYKLCIAKPRH